MSGSDVADDTATVLELWAVRRTFGTGRTAVVAVDDVSLTVAAGEFVAVMGPSGSGKTTLLALAGGLDRPSEGAVTIEGTDLVGLDAAGLAALRRRHVGVVFQQLNLIASLSAAENVALPLELDGAGVRRARKQAESALDEVGLAAMADRFPDDLSGGEQQRVAIARACIGPRRLLLADEPTGALDSLTGETVLEHLRGRAEAGVGVVLATHNARHAAWADRVVFLRDGRISDRLSSPAGPESLLTAEEP